MERIKAQFFRICPKTGRLVGLQPLKQQRVWLIPFVGLAALIWFLVRVVPKPSRAAYPCQRVAMPLAAGFLAWLLGSSAFTLVLRKFNLPLLLRRLINVALCIIIGIGMLGGGSVSASNISPQAYTPHPVNSPIGTAKGLMPGRVSWAHDPLVTDWNGTASNASQSWFNHIVQSEATNLMQWALLSYAGTTTTPAAWDAIFRYFNGGGAGYQPGEKIFIKVNLTTTQADACADASYNWIPSNCGASWSTIGPSPQLMVALLDQLVNVVGVAQSDITIGDSDSLWVNELYNIVHGAFPNVKYLDARGTLGRTKVMRSTTRLYWSTSEANGKNPDYLLQPVVDAKYMINFAILKTHERNGITLTAKNNFGLLSGGNNDVRKPSTAGYYDLHARLPLETESSAWPQRASMAQYRPLVDLNGDTGIGGKTLLYLIDGIFGGEGADPKSSKWAMPPFNNNWPSSLFVSMDEVAIDSVGLDFLSQQFPKYTLAAEGVQDYLHEMALADNPPSGTFYDPEGDGIRMTSQGVHEHWNNATDKLYTRNLGTGNGIDLVYATGPYKVRDNYDGDGRTDAVKFVSGSKSAWVYKSRTSSWSGIWLGTESDMAYVGASDFDGDGKTDVAKLIPSTGAVWYYQSKTGTWDGKWLGGDSFSYVAGSDFDGDGKTDPAKFLSSPDVLWYWSSKYSAWTGVYLGTETMNYVSGSDFDGDGKTDPAKFVPSSGVLWYLGSQTGTWTGVYVGTETYTYVPASDFDRDGKTDPAKFIPGTGVLWYLSSMTSSWVGVSLGTGTYTYVPGCDFNGDGKTEPAKYDESTHLLSWYNSSTWTDIDMGTDVSSIGNGQ